ncbi:Sterol 24-C-methyltransferase [Trichophyton interdigitale]|uniref:Sterol 24-C-methyltransferase n=1 Tax=Trichophyton interdigitale TaxID=101480 RepID=A0A9P5CXW6_9EURO|nr:Sterol 24-C-methyltransferase [Trichophyton interdigitale]KAF3897197.1 Sterol 24-C-methyltransferase [Trichophyton interdigitale]KAG8207770.1 Sterol 24-C-methyltransferase [Trichophyton interdigitale]
MADHFAPAVDPMHGRSAEERSSFLAMLKKGNESHREVTDKYVGFWDEKECGERKDNYMSLVNSYYDLATDFYEEAWAQSFHFCRFGIREPFLQALARHEHYLAFRMGIQPGMKVLDVGCGVGGPAREISTFTGCKVVGVNNNGYQIQRATAHAKKEGRSEDVSFVKSDFMEMDFPDNSFDAVYVIEATVHAPSLQGVYEQIFRILKPGGTFGVYEWVMTDKYDDSDPSHRAIKLGIERGNGIATMMPRKHAMEAVQAAGFVLEHEEDMADKGDTVPWYAPLAGELQARSLWDIFSALRVTRLGRASVSTLLRVLEAAKLAPSGTAQTADELSLGADNLVAGGRAGLFTPMYLMIAKKPAAPSS